MILVGSTLLLTTSADGDHPVSRHSPVLWDNGDYPVAVPTRGVPDGPLAANGDLGLVIGGMVALGAQIGRPGAKPLNSSAMDGGGLGLFFGKNDFWGWPDAVTYHASFQHFSLGYLLLRLREGNGPLLPLPRFTGSMSLEDGTLSAQASGAAVKGGGYYQLQIGGAVVLAGRNVVLASVTPTCPLGVGNVTLDMSLSRCAGNAIRC
jgi:hypothetical protein